MATDNTELFRKYKQTRDVEIRNEIVLIYMQIVKYVAMSLRNIYAKYGDYDDVVNEGVIALIGAVESFDLERGVKFETYANIKIKGAIIDYVRKQDWIPRQVRRFGRELDDTYNILYSELGRSPTNNEIAKRMNLTKEKFAKNMADAAGTMTLSFEELLYEDNFSGMASEKGIGGEADRGIYEKELREMIAQAIETLNPKEKQVISLHYYEKLKFLEIAKVIGVTESRVCQIHSKSMLILKRRLEDYIKM
ncbi:MAG: FliA/WhiG family RNA polymerase sigma factor [Oscillospiraceae bacterium]|nr:FliA/WhiG family RNA polymerase sigma factor [Oscillospiraceae bacterium]